MRKTVFALLALLLATPLFSQKIVQAYPNPVSGGGVLKVGVPTGTVAVIVTDVLGNVLYENKLPGFVPEQFCLELSTEAWPQGLCLVRIDPRNGDAPQVLRIAKK